MSDEYRVHRSNERKTVRIKKGKDRSGGRRWVLGAGGTQMVVLKETMYQVGVGMRRLNWCQFAREKNAECDLQAAKENKRGKKKNRPLSMRPGTRKPVECRSLLMPSQQLVEAHKHGHGQGPTSPTRWKKRREGGVDGVPTHDLANRVLSLLALNIIWPTLCGHCCMLE